MWMVRNTRKPPYLPEKQPPATKGQENVVAQEIFFKYARKMPNHRCPIHNVIELSQHQQQ